MHSRVYADGVDADGSINVEGRSAPGSQAIQIYDVVQLAHHFGVSRIAALYRMRNLRLVTRKEFNEFKQLDDAGNGRQLAERLGLPESDREETRNWFRRRFLGLALAAYRREAISRGKLTELASILALAAADIDRLLEAAGLGAA